MDKFNKLLEFIKDNKLLSIVGGLAILLISLFLFSSNSTKIDNVINISVTPTKDYTVITNTIDYSYYTYNNKNFVFVTNPFKTDKELIRQELNIPQGTDFEVVLPGMAYMENITQTPTP